MNTQMVTKNAPKIKCEINSDLHTMFTKRTLFGHRMRSNGFV